MERQKIFRGLYPRTPVKGGGEGKGGEGGGRTGKGGEGQGREGEGKEWGRGGIREEGEKERGRGKGQDRGGRVASLPTTYFSILSPVWSADASLQIICQLHKQSKLKPIIIYLLRKLHCILIKIALIT